MLDILAIVIDGMQNIGDQDRIGASLSNVEE